MCKLSINKQLLYKKTIIRILTKKNKKNNNIKINKQIKEHVRKKYAITNMMPNKEKKKKHKGKKSIIVNNVCNLGDLFYQNTTPLVHIKSQII